MGWTLATPRTPSVPKSMRVALAGGRAGRVHGGADATAGPADRQRSCSAAATRAACRAAATSWTRISSTPARTHAVTAASVPGRRASTGAPGQLADEALARRADQQRPSQRPELADPRQQLHGLRRRLGEAEPGIEDDPLLGDPRRGGPGQRLPQLGRHLAEQVGVGGAAGHVARACPACASAPPAPRPPPPPPPGPGRRRPDTSLTRSAPASSAARATAALGGVDRDGEPEAAGAEPLDRPAPPGAAPPRRVTGSAPGRVDSPPTSTRSAPSSASRSARRHRGLERRGSGPRRRRSRGWR